MPVSPDLQLRLVAVEHDGLKPHLASTIHEAENVKKHFFALFIFTAVLKLFQNVIESLLKETFSI
jgi:hypothetical protein